MAVGLGSARAAVAGTGPTNVISLTASGSALGTSVPGGFSRSTRDRVLALHSDFTVTANTLVAFSALAKAQATTTIGQDAFGVEFAYAAASMSPVRPRPRRRRLSVQQYNVTNPGFRVVLARQRLDRTASMTVSFTNLTGSNMMGVWTDRWASKASAPSCPSLKPTR